MKGNAVAFFVFSTLVAARPHPGHEHEAEAYDYIIVGAGTSGLVVANRLSEDPSVSVLVIEAGDSVLTNVNVTDPDGYGLAFGTAIDYAFATTPQTYANGLSTTMRAAKALGGTSTINGMAYTRAESNQIDAWEQLGNEGWNWDALFPYYLKSETFQQPDADFVASRRVAYDAALHGTDGPVTIAYPDSTTRDAYPAALNSTFATLGLAWNADGANGNMVGFSPYPKTVDQAQNVRWDAARAYYYPYQDRQNLKLLLNTTANKLTWGPSSDSDDGSATASGVEITAADGTVSTIAANEEVILSAGALVSPLLLELSGVGNPAILSQHGIETVVDLPTVGENLQDQTNNNVGYTAEATFAASYDSGSNTFVAYPDARHVLGANTTAHAAALKAKLASYAETVAAVNGNVTRASDLLEFFELQYELIFGEHQVPYAEILIATTAGAWSAQYWGLLPFARGSVHIGGAASTANAIINPNYFLLDYDVELQAETARYIRDVFATQPFAALADGETNPGLATVPVDTPTDDAAWRTFITEGYRSNFHPVATAALLPREKGGVVDSELRVYGTSNVRVIDASVLPFQVCGHLVSTLYAVAERASDIIKGNI